MGNLFFSYCDIRTGDTISQKAELFLNAMAWKRISLRGAKFSHDCLFVHQCSLAELPISNFTMLCYRVLLCHDHWGVLLSLLGCDEHFNLNADWMSKKIKKKSDTSKYACLFILNSYHMPILCHLNSKQHHYFKITVNVKLFVYNSELERDGCSVCSFKSQPYQRHLAVLLAFAGQVAKPRRWKR